MYHEVFMDKLLQVVSWKYNALSRQLKIFYNDGGAELYQPVPEYVYHNLLRCENKIVFVQRYLQYDLNFNKFYYA
jgi:hypothetical protein